jgi:RhoGAP domain
MKNRVVEHEKVNKMNAVNLGLVMTPVVFGEDDSTNVEDLVSVAKVS